MLDGQKLADSVLIQIGLNIVESTLRVVSRAPWMVSLGAVRHES